MVSTIYSNLSGMIEGKEQVAEEKKKVLTITICKH